MPQPRSASRCWITQLRQVTREPLATGSGFSATPDGVAVTATAAVRSAHDSDEYAVAARIEELFRTPITADRTAVNDPIRGDSGNAQGLFAGVSHTRAPLNRPEYSRTCGTCSRARSAMNEAHRRTDRRRAPGTQAGRRPERPRQGARLHVRTYLVPRADSPTAFLILFRAPGHCHEDTMNRIVSSAKFTTD
nr:hypothetical protein GCM10010200_043000 [Actinomadura rugatobispora]